jgi:CBS domain-containing protein
MNPIEFIRSHPPFDQLSPTSLQLIEQNLEEVSFPRGTRILSQGGAPSKHLYVIRQGAVRMTRTGRVTMVLEEGETFGYASILSGTSSFDVVAEEDVLAYRIPERVFRTLIEQPAFAEFFLESLSKRLRRTANFETPSVGADFTTTADTLITRSPVFVKPEATVAEAARVMRDAQIGSLLVDHDPPGILTDRDFRNRVLAEGLGPETPVHKVMNYPVKSVPAETPLFGALLFLLEENIHHLPLTQAGRIVGVVTGTDLLRHQARSPLFLLKRVENIQQLGTLSDYALEVAGVVETLFKGGLEVTQIGRVVASLNDALMKRLLRLAEDELGPPPTPYAWIVFGSGGRMEQTLLTDQDNALVYAEDTDEAKRYFAALSERVVHGLMEAGFPSCPGGYMATNWHRPLAEWVRLFKGWVNTPEPTALLEASIFFDFRPIYGTLSLQPLDEILFNAKGRTPFLPQLARSTLEFQPPLGFFRRIREEEDGVNLKKGGIAPIVGLARLYALEARAMVRPTLERLEAATKAQKLSREGADTLAEAFRFLLRLRLREQLRAMYANETPSNRVRLDDISSLEQRHLKEAFMAIRESQDSVAMRYRTDMLG